MFYYFKQPDIQVNLAVVAYLFGAVTACYFLLFVYVKYMPGGLFVNGMALGLSEIAGNLLAGYMMTKFGIKNSMIALNTVSLIGGLLIHFLGESYLMMMPAFVMLSKFGISGVGAILFCATVNIFPTAICASVMGIGDFVGKFLTIFMPIVAEKQPPTPMLFFTVASVIGIFLSRYIRYDEKAGAEP